MKNLALFLALTLTGVVAGSADAADDFGFDLTGTSPCVGFVPPPQNGLYPKAACIYTGLGGFVEVKLRVSKRYAGDNYKVQAALENFIEGSSGSQPYKAEAHIKAETSILTAWKRIYVERDHMFRRGALLARNFDPATCGTGNEPGCNVVEVFDWSSTERLQINDVVTLFQTDRPAEGGLTASVINVSAGNFANTRFIQLSVNLKTVGLAWAASTDPADNPPVMKFELGNSAALGVTASGGTACRQLDTTNGPNACFYNVDTAKVQQAFNDGYIEFVYPPSGAGAIPYLPQSFFDGGNIYGIQIGMYHYAWFANKMLAGGPTPPPNTANNYFHFIGANTSLKSANPDTFRGGYSLSTLDMAYVFVKTYEAAGLPLEVTAKQIQNACAHEPGHLFDLNRCHTNPSIHDAPNTPSWCDGYNHCGLGGNTAVQSLMIPDTDANPSARFDVEDLLTGDALCSPPDKLDSTLRTHADPD